MLAVVAFATGRLTELIDLDFGVLADEGVLLVSLLLVLLAKDVVEGFDQFVGQLTVLFLESLLNSLRDTCLEVLDKGRDLLGADLVLLVLLLEGKEDLFREGSLELFLEDLLAAQFGLGSLVDVWDIRLGGLGRVGQSVRDFRFNFIDLLGGVEAG